MNNIFEFFYNILFNPVETFRNFSCEKPYKLPLLIVCLSSLFLMLLSENQFGYTSLLGFVSKTINLIIYWLFITFFIDLIAKIFRNESSFKKLLSLISLSFIPWIFLAPLKLLKHSQFSAIASILILAVWTWTIILQILAISETYNISRKNAILVMLIPFIATIVYFIWLVDFFVKLFQVSAL